MTLRRHQRRRLSSWLVVALLFMQFATAAYACRLAPQGQQGQTPAIAMPAMPGCDGDMSGGIDPNQPQLCKAHCEQEARTVNSTPAFDAQPLPVLVAVLDWTGDFALAPTPARPLHPMPAGAPPPGTPPLYLSLLVLRN